LKSSIATNVFVAAVKCTKHILNQGSAPDPTQGAYQNMQTLVGWSGDRSPSPLSYDAFGVLSRHSSTTSHWEARPYVAPDILSYDCRLWH